MIVGQLKEYLKSFPDDSEAYIRGLTPIQSVKSIAEQRRYDFPEPHTSKDLDRDWETVYYGNLDQRGPYLS
jgi:hypothetical protein